ncbi:DUF2634 domain-containing protein [Hydrogenoanaerobacterium sp.]|uniref:DUF2634 domain-containing protein n=1 Tax=Hydrogenoanaerobacterium sp. TaxID=2953763 RepID=UPI00289DFFAC|nr:DUF2634 domain-containing protein [Hydrogenoanaerobacterium sp.]
MSLFPIIQPRGTAEQTSELPLYREVAWDYEHNIPIWSRGSPVFITGAEAVLVWAWKALQVPRFRYEIYSHGYGNECEELIGQPFTEELKRSEAARYVRECLEINPYIEEIDDINVEFSEGALKISCRLITAYGEVKVHV